MLAARADRRIHIVDGKIADAIVLSDQKPIATAVPAERIIGT
jgi:hypothetical protein